MELQVGRAAPGFQGEVQNGASVSLEGSRGQTLVLFFYPKDDTPG